MIPMNVAIEIIKAGEPDIWGETSVDEIIVKKGNIRSQTKVVTDGNGEEVVSNFTILFVGFVNVTMDDKFKFVEPNGRIIEKSAIDIKFMRNWDGSIGFTKAVL